MNFPELRRAPQSAGAIHLQPRSAACGAVRLRWTSPTPVQETQSPQLRTAKTACASSWLLGLCGRGSIEQRAMPRSNNHVQHWRRHRRRSSHKKHGRGNHSNRRRRMHHHADRAMIGIRRRRVDMGHQDKSHQGQQQQTNQRSRTHSPGLMLARSIQPVSAVVFH